MFYHQCEYTTMQLQLQLQCEYTTMLIFCSIVIYVLFEYACFRFLLKIQLAFDLKCEFGPNEPVICRLNFYSFWVMYWEFWSFGICRLNEPVICRLNFYLSMIDIHWLGHYRTTPKKRMTWISSHDMHNTCQYVLYCLHDMPALSVNWLYMHLEHVELRVN